MLLAIGITVALPQCGLACTVCYGATNPAAAKAMTWGILIMLGVTFGVLGGIAGFACYLWKRSRNLPIAPGQATAIEGIVGQATNSTETAATPTAAARHSPAWHLQASHTASGGLRPHSPFARSTPHHGERPWRA